MKKPEIGTEWGYYRKGIIYQVFDMTPSVEESISRSEMEAGDHRFIAACNNRAVTQAISKIDKALTKAGCKLESEGA